MLYQIHDIKYMISACCIQYVLCLISAYNDITHVESVDICPMETPIVISNNIWMFLDPRYLPVLSFVFHCLLWCLIIYIVKGQMCLLVIQKSWKMCCDIYHVLIISFQCLFPWVTFLVLKTQTHLFINLFAGWK